MKLIRNGLKAWQDQMLSKDREKQAFLNSVVLPYVLERQKERFGSENTSEGSRWQSIEASYAQRKRKRYANFPGGGEKILVATGRLAFAAGGEPRESGDFEKITSGSGILIRIGVPYAPYQNPVRPFTTFSDVTHSTIKQMIISYFGEASK